MDRQARNRLRRIVTKARSTIERDVKTQLKRLGIEEGGKTIPAGRLIHLNNEDKELRDEIITTIQKEKVKEVKLREAYDRYIRHVGFTYLNRLAAIRALEARGLIEETIIQRDEYAGMSGREYKISERENVSDPAEITKKSLLEAFKEVSKEIKVLFDVEDEYSLLFPGPRTLDQLRRLLNSEIQEEDWLEDDIIGWIYQYYNSEARDRFKKKRRTPRADDIPVINQFYTPRWLVRALIDNTLGRLWLEMKGRLPKPGGVLSPTEERLREPQGETVDYCSYLIPPRQDPTPRGEKPVREIKVLDPACGSGHFLVYAFNVLYRMYLEDEPDTPREEIPNLILENNLYGIDIDLRAVQLAALSLFLKAKEYNPGIKVKNMNLVCADARITDGDLQKDFISGLEPDVDLQRIFAKLFTELNYTYDIGSLLKVRKPFERLLEERGKKVQSRFRSKITGQSSFSKEGGIGGQSELSIEDEKGVLVKPAVTLEEMLDALLRFEEEAMEKRDMGTMLFAAEAEKSVGLLSLLSQRYDVVVMNPPYGDMPKSTKEYAKEHYPRTHYDYYAAFIEQAVSLCEENGFTGMLTGRTFMFLKWFEKVRTEILWEKAKPEVLLDLGSNVLDEAIGLWAATVVRKLKGQTLDMEAETCVFFSLTPYLEEEERISIFHEALLAWCRNDDHEILYPVRLGTLKKLPRMPYSYWIPDSLVALFEKYPPLDRDNANKPDEPKIADLKVGLQTGDDRRFVRYWWEVNLEDIATSKEETLKGKKWVPFVKGGDAYYSDIPLVVNWANNGEEIKKFAEETGKPRVQNEDYYFKSGLCWSRILSSIIFDMRFLPLGTVFDCNGPILLPAKKESLWSILSLINSSITAFLFLSLDPTLHTRQIGYVSQLPISLKDIGQMKIGDFAKEIYEIARDWDRGNEVSTHFIKPWILQVFNGINPSGLPKPIHPLYEAFYWSDSSSSKEIRSIKGSQEKTLLDLAGLCVERERRMKERFYETRQEIDERVYKVYNISEKDRVILEKELRTLRGFPKALKKTREEAIKPELTIKEHVARLLSYYVKLILEGAPDGIVPMNDLIVNVRHRLTDDFGEKRLERVEREIEEILGSTIEDWLTKDFFDFHVGLYGESYRAKRPIFWHLTSTNFAKKRGSKGAFNCFLHYQKLDGDTIPKIRTKREYLKGPLDRTRWKVDRLRNQLHEARDSEDRNAVRKLQEEFEESLDVLEELQSFDEKIKEVSKPRENPTELDESSSWVERKIAEIRDNGWKPVLDYGVRVNIEPLKEADLLHKAAERVR